MFADYFFILNFFVNVVTVAGSGGGATTEQDRVAATHAAAGGSSSHFSPPPKNARFVVEFHCENGPIRARSQNTFKQGMHYLKIQSLKIFIN